MSFTKLAVIACFTAMIAARPQMPMPQWSISADDAHSNPFGGNVLEWFGSLSENQRDVLKDVFTDPTASVSQIKDKLEQFVATLPSNQQAKIHEMNEKVEQGIQQLIQNLQSKPISTSAKQALQEIQASLRNESLTPEQQCEQIISKLNSISAEDRKTIGMPENLPSDGCIMLTQFMRSGAGAGAFA
ncbi:hypothetical protein AAVH_12827 [Aphelenchoides avenae]|nr:hypothetical protein AAVH_12827 [Aphelenchus avenae]